MKPIIELGPCQCRYPVTGDLPEVRALAAKMPHARHLSCAAATRPGRSYCDEHHELCSTGPGKPWQGLAGMMKNVEQTVRDVKADYADAYETESSRDLVEMAATE